MLDGASSRFQKFIGDIQARARENKEKEVPVSPPEVGKEHILIATHFLKTKRKLQYQPSFRFLEMQFRQRCRE